MISLGRDMGVTLATAVHECNTLVTLVKDTLKPGLPRFLIR